MLWSAKRDTIAAYRFLIEALGTSGVTKNLTVDKSSRNKAAADLFVNDLSAGGKLIEIRQAQYSNTIVEQNGRGGKRRLGPMFGFRSFVYAPRAIAGIPSFELRFESATEPPFAS